MTLNHLDKNTNIADIIDAFQIFCFICMYNCFHNCSILYLLSFSYLILVSFSSDDSPRDSVSLQLLFAALRWWSWRAFFWIFLTLARWFWNHTWTIRRLNPVSLANVSLTLRQGFGDTSKDALKALLCCVFSIVRGRFGPRLPSTLDGKTSSGK